MLERGVRGKKAKRENAREVGSILGEDEVGGEVLRKLRLRVRKEGVRECLEDLWVRRGMGVTGSWKFMNDCSEAKKGTGSIPVVCCLLGLC